MGKVYKIVVNDLCYYGSTKQKYLSKRQSRHNDNLRNNPKQKLYQYCLAQNISKINCELIYEGDDYIEYENDLIKNDSNCLNMRWSKSSKERKKETAKKYNQSEKGKITNAKVAKTYREKHKEKILQNKKDYYLKNKDKWKTEHTKEVAKLRNSQKKFCDICGVEMNYNSINRHKKRVH